MGLGEGVAAAECIDDPRQIPPLAGENASVRDDAFVKVTRDLSYKGF